MPNTWGIHLFCPLSKENFARVYLLRLHLLHFLRWRCHFATSEALTNRAWEKQLSWLNDFDVCVNEAAYAKLLRVAASANDFLLGQRLHLHIIRSGHDLTALLSNLLVRMYGKCGAMGDALSIFDSMSTLKNKFSWTLIIESYIQQEQFERAAQLFNEMERSYTIPDLVTYVIMVSGCAGKGALDEGRRLHIGLTERGHDLEVIVCNALVNMYGKCSCLEDAQKMFDMTQARTLVSWNTIVAVHSQQVCADETLQLAQQMLVEGITPDKFTFVSMLNCSTAQMGLNEGKQLHSLILHCGFQSDIIVTTALMKLYGSHNCLVEVCRLFDSMHTRDLVVWNTLIAMYTQLGEGGMVLGLAEQMQLEGALPDKVTLLSLLSTFTDLGVMKLGIQAHICIISRNYESDVSLGNSLITLYGKCGKFEHAQTVFNVIPERDVISWNTFIVACAQKGEMSSNVALQLFQQMQVEGVMANKVTFMALFDLFSCPLHAPDCGLLHACILGSEVELDGLVGTAIIGAYGRCDALMEAKGMFHKLSKRDESMWNAMILAYVQHGGGREAMELFQQMRMEGIMGNKVSYLSVLDTCSNEANLVEGKRVHVEVVSTSYVSDINVGTALFDMYGKCGVVEEAQSFFDMMLERDVVSWNAFGKVCSQHGLGMQALQFLEKRVSSVAPNHATFSSALLACSHAGLVCDGFCCFIHICEGYEVRATLKHFNIFIDMLGRAGQLDETIALVYSMQCQPSSTSWLALLDACRKYSAVGCAKFAAEHTIELQHANSAAHIMFSNIWVTSSLA